MTPRLRSAGLALFVLSYSLTTLSAAGQAPAADPARRFEAAVVAYEQADRASPPPKGAILLAGDSQFFRWKTLADDLPGYTVVNRGVDSFQTSDLLHYTERLVLPHAPRMIVLHVGGNDVNLGKTPEQILADVQAFVAKVRTALPAVPIAFTSITPSPGRWSQAATRQRANALVRAYVLSQPNLHYIDLWDAMLTPDGQPREDIWVEDRVHPNQEGYRIRVRIMRPLLGAVR
jgi:lysophospholipase L1-like esterase